MSGTAGAVGQVLLGGVRQVDLAGRYGGEEFALILPEPDVPGALKLAERVLVALESTPVELAEGKTLQVTASFRVALKDELPFAGRARRGCRRGALRGQASRQEPRHAGPRERAPEPGKPERRVPKKATAAKKRTTQAKGEI